MAILTKFWTYAQIKEKIENDCDLEINDLDTAFISNTEFLGYVNEAIDRCEQIVHSLYEDYFLSKATITLTQGVEEYALPSTIYSHKIRRVMYRNGSKVYEVGRLRDWKKFENYENQKASNPSSGDYGYFIINTVAGQPKIVFTPTPYESGAYVTVWFIRQANNLVADSDVLDIPEAHSYILAYLKKLVYRKESNQLLLQEISAEVDREHSLLETTLTAMIADTNNEIEPDLAVYGEHI